MSRWRYLLVLAMVWAPQLGSSVSASVCQVESDDELVELPPQLDGLIEGLRPNAIVPLEIDPAAYQEARKAARLLFEVSNEYSAGWLYLYQHEPEEVEEVAALRELIDQSFGEGTVDAEILEALQSVLSHYLRWDNSRYQDQTIEFIDFSGGQDPELMEALGLDPWDPRGLIYLLFNELLPTEEGRERLKKVGAQLYQFRNRLEFLLEDRYSAIHSQMTRIEETEEGFLAPTAGFPEWREVQDFLEKREELFEGIEVDQGFLGLFRMIYQQRLERLMQDPSEPPQLEEVLAAIELEKEDAEELKEQAALLEDWRRLEKDQGQIRQLHSEIYERPSPYRFGASIEDIHRDVMATFYDELLGSLELYDPREAFQKRQELRQYAVGEAEFQLHSLFGQNSPALRFPHIMGDHEGYRELYEKVKEEVQKESNKKGRELEHEVWKKFAEDYGVLAEGRVPLMRFIEEHAEELGIEGFQVSEELSEEEEYANAIAQRNLTTKYYLILSILNTGEGARQRDMMNPDGWRDGLPIEFAEMLNWSLDDLVRLAFVRSYLPSYHFGSYEHNYDRSLEGEKQRPLGFASGMGLSSALQSSDDGVRHPIEQYADLRKEKPFQKREIESISQPDREELARISDQLFDFHQKAGEAIGLNFRVDISEITQLGEIQERFEGLIQRKQTLVPGPSFHDLGCVEGSEARTEHLTENSRSRRESAERIRSEMVWHTETESELRFEAGEELDQFFQRLHRCLDDYEERRSKIVEKLEDNVQSDLDRRMAELGDSLVSLVDIVDAYSAGEEPSEGEQQYSLDTIKNRLAAFGEREEESTKKFYQDLAHLFSDELENERDRRFRKALEERLSEDLLELIPREAFKVESYLESWQKRRNLPIDQLTYFELEAFEYLLDRFELYTPLLMEDSIQGKSSVSLIAWLEHRLSGSEEGVRAEGLAFLQSSPELLDVVDRYAHSKDLIRVVWGEDWREKLEVEEPILDVLAHGTRAEGIMSYVQQHQEKATRMFTASRHRQGSPFLVPSQLEEFFELEGASLDRLEKWDVPTDSEHTDLLLELAARDLWNTYIEDYLDELSSAERRAKAREFEKSEDFPPREVLQWFDEDVLRTSDYIKQYEFLDLPDERRHPMKKAFLGRAVDQVSYLGSEALQSSLKGLDLTASGLFSKPENLASSHLQRDFDRIKEEPLEGFLQIIGFDRDAEEVQLALDTLREREGRMYREFESFAETFFETTQNLQESFENSQALSRSEILFLLAQMQQDSELNSMLLGSDHLGSPEEGYEPSDEVIEEILSKLPTDLRSEALEWEDLQAQLKDFRTFLIASRNLFPHYSNSLAQVTSRLTLNQLLNRLFEEPESKEILRAASEGRSSLAAVEQRFQHWEDYFDKLEVEIEPSLVEQASQELADLHDQYEVNANELIYRMQIALVYQVFRGERLNQMERDPEHRQRIRDRIEGVDRELQNLFDSTDQDTDALEELVVKLQTPMKEDQYYFVWQQNPLLFASLFPRGEEETEFNALAMGRPLEEDEAVQYKNWDQALKEHLDERMREVLREPVREEQYVLLNILPYQESLGVRRMNQLDTEEEAWEKTLEDWHRKAVVEDIEFFLKDSPKELPEEIDRKELSVMFEHYYQRLYPHAPRQMQRDVPNLQFSALQKTASLQNFRERWENFDGDLLSDDQLLALLEYSLENAEGSVEERLRSLHNPAFVHHALLERGFEEENIQELFQSEALRVQLGLQSRYRQHSIVALAEISSESMGQFLDTYELIRPSQRRNEILSASGIENDLIASIKDLHRSFERMELNQEDVVEALEDYYESMLENQYEHVAERRDIRRREDAGLLSPAGVGYLALDFGQMLVMGVEQGLAGTYRMLEPIPLFAYAEGYGRLKGDRYGAYEEALDAFGQLGNFTKHDLGAWRYPGQVLSRFHEDRLDQENLDIAGDVVADLISLAIFRQNFGGDVKKLTGLAARGTGLNRLSKKGSDALKSRWSSAQRGLRASPRMQRLEERVRRSVPTRLENQARRMVRNRAVQRARRIRAEQIGRAGSQSILETRSVPLRRMKPREKAAVSTRSSETRLARLKTKLSEVAPLGFRLPTDSLFLAGGMMAAYRIALGQDFDRGMLGETWAHNMMFLSAIFGTHALLRGYPRAERSMSFMLWNAILPELGDAAFVTAGRGSGLHSEALRELVNRSFIDVAGYDALRLEKRDYEEYRDDPRYFDESGRPIDEAFLDLPGGVEMLEQWELDRQTYAQAISGAALIALIKGAPLVGRTAQQAQMRRQIENMPEGGRGARALEGGFGLVSKAYGANPRKVYDWARQRKVNSLKIENGLRPSGEKWSEAKIRREAKREVQKDFPELYESVDPMTVITRTVRDWKLQGEPIEQLFTTARQHFIHQYRRVQWEEAPFTSRSPRFRDSSEGPPHLQQALRLFDRAWRRGEEEAQAVILRSSRDFTPEEVQAHLTAFRSLSEKLRELSRREDKQEVYQEELWKQLENFHPTGSSSSREFWQSSSGQMVLKEVVLPRLRAYESERGESRPFILRTDLRNGKTFEEPRSPDELHLQARHLERLLQTRSEPIRDPLREFAPEDLAMGGATSSRQATFELRRRDPESGRFQIEKHELIATRLSQQIEYVNLPDNTVLLLYRPPGRNSATQSLLIPAGFEKVVSARGGQLTIRDRFQVETEINFSAGQVNYYATAQGHRLRMDAFDSPKTGEPMSISDFQQWIFNHSVLPSVMLRVMDLWAEPAVQTPVEQLARNIERAQTLEGERMLSGYWPRNRSIPYAEQVRQAIEAQRKAFDPDQALSQRAYSRIPERFSPRRNWGNEELAEKIPLADGRPQLLRYLSRQQREGIQNPTGWLRRARGKDLSEMFTRQQLEKAYRIGHYLKESRQQGQKLTGND